VSEIVGDVMADIGEILVGVAILWMAFMLYILVEEIVDHE
jgi:hypothetical protein